MNTPKTAAATGSFLRRYRLHLMAGMAVALIAAVLGWLYYHSRYPSWYEEVRLSDGRVITIHQRHQVFENYGTNQSWVEIDLPELGGKRVWHSYLIPQRVDVHMGAVYVFGMPARHRQYRFYQYPKNYMVAFAWNGSEFVRVPFLSIPASLRNQENVFSCIPENRPSLLTVNYKDGRWCPPKGDDKQFTRQINLPAFQALAIRYSRRSGGLPLTE
jgi:hypothetical protein